MAEKAGKIERIDKTRNPSSSGLTADIPATSIEMGPREPQETLLVSHLRGQGGIQKDMNGVTKRDPKEEHYEHLLEGRAMNAILQPEALP